MGTRREANHGRLSGRRMVAAVGAVMMLLAVGAVGCGGGNSGTLPLAGVWVANSGTPRVQHYTGTDFGFNGSIAFPPVPVLNSAFVSPQDTLFDANNNLWVVDGGNPATGRGQAVYRFLFNQVISLNTTSNPPPNFVITTLGGVVKFAFPQFAAFDAAGDLWVSDSGANAIFKFSTAQLSTGAGFSGTPAAVLTNAAPPAPATFNGPLGIAFDASGNLWVENNGGTTIVQIAAGVINTAVGVTAVAPATVLLSNVPPPGGLPTINNPWGIVFDISGNMWITNEQLSIGACSGSVVEFTKAAIAGGGVLTPAANVVITQTANSLCDPNGITMNKSGNIVVANAAGNSLAEYTASQITNSGNPTPHTLIIGAGTLLNAPTGLTFGPLTLQ